MSLIFKKLDIKSEKKIYLKSWAEAFERDSDIERVEWAILCSFNHTYIVKDGLRIVAGYSFLKRDINLYPYFGLIANNMFVIPSYQGKYLNIKLAKFAFDNLPCREAILFGAPRRNVVPFHKRAGWKIENPKPLFSCNLERLDELKEFKHNFSEIFTYPIKKNSLHLNNLSEPNLEKIRFKPTKEYLNWRFAEHPYCKKRSYEISKTNSNSFMVFSYYAPLKQLNILLSSFSSEEDEISLLLNIYCQAEIKKASIIRFLANEDYKSKLFRRIKELSFEEKYYMIIKLIGEETKAIYSSTLPNFVFDLGDNDSY